MDVTKQDLVSFVQKITIKLIVNLIARIYAIIAQKIQNRALTVLFTSKLEHLIICGALLSQCFWHLPQKTFHRLLLLPTI